MKRLCIALFCIFLGAVSAQTADLYFELQRGKKTTVAFPPFYSKDSDADVPGLLKEIEKTAQEDLLFPKLVELSEAGPPVDSGTIDFASWSASGADLLVTGAVSIDKENVVLVGTVYELPQGKPLFQKKYWTVKRSARRLAHEFVADIFYRFTGDRGVSESRIAFINNSSGFKELYLVDYDGSHLQKLTQDKSVIVLPRWAPNQEAILYTSYKRNNPDLYLYKLKDGSVRTISARQGMNTSACYSPDGKLIVLTLSVSGTPHLFLLDAQGKMIKQLTHGYSANTSASFSPDGRKIVFVSDRPGWPQLYMMDVDGSNLKRLTSSGYCDSPAWSPRGDKIAYERGNAKGKYHIAIYDVASGKNTEIQTPGARNESPSFSPDGRFLVYASNRKGQYALYISSIDGSWTRKLTDVAGDSTAPTWAP